MTLEKLIEAARSKWTPEQREKYEADRAEAYRLLNIELNRQMQAMQVSEELLNKRCTL